MFIIYFSLLNFGLICFFSSFLRCKLRSVISDLSSFLILVFSAINFPIITAELTSHKFWYVVLLFLLSLWISYLTHGLSRCILFGFQNFRDFPEICSLLTLKEIPLWLKDILFMTWIFKNLMRLVLWPRIWPILVSVPCALEKNVYIAIVGWSVL